MRINDDYETWNAANQIGKDDSVLAFWKKALKVRKDNEVLVRISLPFSVVYDCH
jgi:oligo-1,6-glucosidase